MRTSSSNHMMHYRLKYYELCNVCLFDGFGCHPLFVHAFLFASRHLEPKMKDVGACCDGLYRICHGRSPPHMWSYLFHMIVCGETLHIHLQAAHLCMWIWYANVWNWNGQEHGHNAEIVSDPPDPILDRFFFVRSEGVKRSLEQDEKKDIGTMFSCFRNAWSLFKPSDLAGQRLSKTIEP
jgi:hypothetical protein